MTSDEIREFQLAGAAVYSKGQPVTNDGQAFFLQEIAAQLAELNERLPSYDTLVSYFNRDES